MAIQYAAFALGVSAMITQIALMRELLTIINGNEIGLGLILGNWLLVMGLGVRLGCQIHQSFSVVFLGYGFAFLAFLPWILVSLVRLWRMWFFVRGAELDVGITFVTSFLLVAPYCLLSGLLFGMATVIYAKTRPSALVSRLYTADCVGSIFGGVLFTLFACFSMDHFWILLWPAGFLIVGIFLCAYESRNKALFYCSLILMACLPGGVLVSKHLHRITLALQYPGQEIRYQQNSHHGQVVVTQTSGQLNFHANGHLIFSTENAQQSEESVHYTMSQRPEAKHILLISGGISGVAKELCKYPIHTLDYVELDQSLIESGRLLIPSNLADKRIVVQITDGRVFMERTPKKYDVIIVNVSTPSTLYMNRFFTIEFLQSVKRRLTSDGVVSIASSYFANTISSELKNAYATMGQTMKNVFREVLVVPGGRTYFVASESALYPDISERLSRFHISRIFMTSNYIADVMRPDRLALIESAISSPAPLNRDFNPVLYWQQNVYWLSQFGPVSWWIFAIIGGIFLVYAFCQNAVSLSLFVAGFSGSTLQLVLFWGFQICCGSLYLQLGALSAVFMGGLAMGSWALNLRYAAIKTIHLAALNGFLVLIAGGLLLGLPWIFQLNGKQAPHGLIYLSFVLMTGLLSFGVGAQFPVACKCSSSFPFFSLAKLYAADLFGACLGAFATSTVLMPLLGIKGCCSLCALANFVVALRLLRQR